MYVVFQDSKHSREFVALMDLKLIEGLEVLNNCYLPEVTLQELLFIN